MENFDKYIQLLLTKNLEEQDNELFRQRCKKRFESAGKQGNTNRTKNKFIYLIVNDFYILLVSFNS
ncbi:hypothetical protein J6W34_01680, partial [bacterium]|nr:hypothetical protein [bacterium]